MSNGKQRQHYARSLELLAWAEQLIPTGTQTFSKSPMHFPRGCAPHFLREGRGGRVWDVDDNEYVDLMAALLAVMLGYRDADVDAAIADQLRRGISFSLATRLEGELAERLVARIPCAEMARFGKNGSDMTGAAVRIARAATGREHVIATGYHGWQDWYVAATSRDKGVPACVGELTHHVPFNDTDALREQFQRHTGGIAAVIMEPVHSAEPAAGYLETVRRLTREHGAVLIFDEIITGCRIAAGGAQARYGVTPDLTCLGKALGNGMPLSALVGRRELMSEFEQVFISATFGGEALSLAAAIAVLDKLEREPVLETLWRTGEALAAGVRQRIAGHGLEAVMGVVGPPPMQNIAFHDHAHAAADVIKTLYVTAMLEQGVLTTGSINVMYAHDADDVARILDAFDAACAHIAAALQQPGVAQRLHCPVIRPVFPVRER